ncbi:MAG: chemotaxis response regulator protein-glutamate methylesterase [Anaerolineae bacterium]|jgi:two-component system chemotaxis response regulator CheB
MARPIRLLVVDDSVFLRHTLTKRLGDYPQVDVIGHAIDGLDALDKIVELEPDVVILDVEMPRMDGLTALERIMAECPTPVIMLSAYTQRGARTTVQALIRGAVDFVPKPSSNFTITEVIDELVEKVQVAADTSPTQAPTLPEPEKETREPASAPRPFGKGDTVIVIGASTGGPRALQQVLSSLPADLPAAVTVIQHMPVGFTRSLAQRLNEGSPLTVREASPGDRLERGKVLLAPGNYHLVLGRNGTVKLDQGPPRNHVRPAVDVTMETAAEVYGQATIGVVLTGMGNDGTAGAARIKEAGGTVIAEDDSTSIVYGMPRSVSEAGLADYRLPLPKIAAMLAKLVE